MKTLLPILLICFSACHNNDTTTAKIDSLTAEIKKRDSLDKLNDSLQRVKKAVAMDNQRRKDSVNKLSLDRQNIITQIIAPGDYAKTNGDWGYNNQEVTIYNNSSFDVDQAVIAINYYTANGALYKSEAVLGETSRQNLPEWYPSLTVIEV